MEDVLVLPQDEKLQALDGRAFEPIEGRRLAHLASLVPSDQAIVEIGSYRGKSTCFLAAGAARGGGARVYAIDIWDFGRDKLLNKKGVYQEFVEQVASVGLADRITPVKGDSVSVARVWNRPIGLLWIDGCHQYEAVLADYEAWSDYVVPGGWIAFHDYGRKKWPGVKQCVDNHVIPSGLWEDVRLHESVWSARRKAS